MDGPTQQVSIIRPYPSGLLFFYIHHIKHVRIIRILSSKIKYTCDIRQNYDVSETFGPAEDKTTVRVYRSNARVNLNKL